MNWEVLRRKFGLKRSEIVGGWRLLHSEEFHNLLLLAKFHVEAESNTSTVTLRVVGGDEKEVSNLRQYNTVASRKGLGPEKDCAG
jgi:hypothetical protein